jgi:hypothetical protein
LPSRLAQCPFHQLLSLSWLAAYVRSHMLAKCLLSTWESSTHTLVPIQNKTPSLLDILNLNIQ